MRTLADFELARRNLSAMVRRQARLAAGYVQWTATADAPTNFKALCRMWRECETDGRPFKVSSLNCENTIYMHAEDNWHFRLWHDILHVTMQQDFSYLGELAVATVHLKAAANWFGSESPEFALMRIETVDQLNYFHNTGNFVPNQLEFAKAIFLHN